MELIPVINFEALNNPSFFSRVLSVFELGKFSQSHRFWKWGAFLVAFVYTFNYVANRVKVLILHYHHKSKSFLANTQPLLSSTFDDELCSSDDDDDGAVSVSSGADDEAELSEDEREMNVSRFLPSCEDFSMLNHDFTVKGQKRKFRVPRRKKSLGDDFSLSDLVNGNGIVKLWDGFGLGVESSFPFLEINKDEWKKLGSFFGSPAVVTTAERGGEPGLLGLRVWDFRCSVNEPVGRTSWRSDRTGLTVGDVRMITEKGTEEGDEMWWDADGVSG